MHAVLGELVPGGVSKRISAAQAAHLLENITPSGTVAAARCELASEFLEDLRRIDTQMRDAKKKLATAVAVSGTTFTAVFGVGPVVAAMVIGSSAKPLPDPPPPYDPPHRSGRKKQVTRNKKLRRTS